MSAALLLDAVVRVGVVAVLVWAALTARAVIIKELTTVLVPCPECDEDQPDPECEECYGVGLVEDYDEPAGDDPGEQWDRAHARSVDKQSGAIL